MAKTIKFNLICDGKPIRTIEDLQENFCIEDVLKYYHNGLLQRWLDVRSYKDEHAKVAAIASNKDMDVIKELLQIFAVEMDEKKIEEGIYMLEFRQEKEVLYEAYQKDGFKVKSIVDDYAAGYRQLVDGIFDNPQDAAKIKANIAEMVNSYQWVLDLDYRNLFWELRAYSPLAIMCLLMNEGTRRYYLPAPDEEMDSDKEQMYTNLKNLVIYEIFEPDFAKMLGDNLHWFNGATEAYWKDMEANGKKYMILDIGEGDYVRAAGVKDGDMGREDVLGKFPILDGIDYKSNNTKTCLIYMEV